jgi:HEPN domain-containing protein
VSTPDFKSAARRHYRDAQYLLDDQRWPNADHLAGVAAECGLKAIMLGYLGAKLNQQSKPVWGSTNLGHVNQFWKELPLIVAGRTAPVFATLVAGPAPFANWDVADRYSDGNGITEQCSRDHLNNAKEVLEVLEQAIRDGVLP